jgi:hypothetical protein
VFFYCPLKKKSSFVICFDLQFEEVTKKFHGFKETLDAGISVNHHKRSQKRQPQRDLL